MRTVALDDERLLLDYMVENLRSIDMIDSAEGFSNENDLLEYAQSNRIDVAFLDIRTGKLGGIAVADKLTEIQPDINIIFVTAYPDYALDAMKQHASGYLLKPASAEDIIGELRHLRKEPKSGKPVTVVTFGNFDVSADGEIISFSRRQSKEMLAYLVHLQGHSADRKEIAGVLYEDRVYDRNVQKQLQNIISDLSATLTKYGIESILVKGNNCYAVDNELIDCDMYDFLAGKQAAIEKFCGYYMENYSWAEDLKGMLSEMKKAK